MNQKKQAALFRRKYKLRKITCDGLEKALNEQGYTIIEFNGIEENEDVSVLSSELGLSEYMAQSRCFTYRDDKYRLVFIQEGLTGDERTVLLAHEEGHICNDHLVTKTVFGDDVLQEYEANEFAHFLLQDKNGSKKRTITWLVVILCLLILTALVTGFLLKTRHDKLTFTEDLYRTESGSKYHVRDCIYLRDKKEVYRLTYEEFYSGKYEPCEVCKPDERKQ